MQENKEKTSSPLTAELRDRMKVLMDRELDRLPELLEGLEEKDRLDAILRLMPYIMPKVQPVSSKTGEPLTFDW